MIEAALKKKGGESGKGGESESERGFLINCCELIDGLIVVPAWANLLR